MIAVHGPTGELRWSYHLAASLGPWTMHSENAQLTLTASVVSQDVYAVSQRPLTFVVPRPSGDWRWKVLTLQIVDGSLSATLDPQE